MFEKLDPKDVKWAAFYFILSAVITSWFIQVSPLYDSFAQRLISGGIAGAKWGVQLVAAFYFLGDKKMKFVRAIGFTCFLGSLILLPFAISSSLGMSNNSTFFLGTLMVSVAAMVVSYFLGVKKTGVGSHWWAGWLFCLAIAITLQLKVVFNVSLFNQ